MPARIITSSPSRPEGKPCRLTTRAPAGGKDNLFGPWEGFVIEQVAAKLGDRNLYYWATYRGAEMDLFEEVNGKRIGIEIIHADAPTLTESMHIARADLRLDRVFIITLGPRSWPLADWAEVVNITNMTARLDELLKN